MGKVPQQYVVAMYVLVGIVIVTQYIFQPPPPPPPPPPPLLSTGTITVKTSKLTPQTTPRTRIWNITLLVELRGELGNHLALLAHARIVQIIAQTKFPNIRLQLVGQHHKHPKWRRPQKDIRLCFPQLRDLIHEGGIYDAVPNRRAEFLQIQEYQREWLRNSNFTPEEQLLLFNPREEGLEFLQRQLLRLPDVPSPLSLILNSTTTTSGRYSFPYLLINDFGGIWAEGLKNRVYYDDLRHYLQFRTSSKACCGFLPENRTNEVVYHHRNFMAEMKEKAAGNHFTEANPETVAVLFGNVTQYNPHDTNITITSRYKRGLEPYVEALHNTTGITATVMHNRTGVQDFCYLMTTTRELVGKYHSTFARWAAFLGTSQTNRFYGLNLNLKGLNTDTNYTGPDHPVHLLEYIEQNQRSFISEQYWQPAEL